jgi:hypothetical protein
MPLFPTPPNGKSVFTSWKRVSLTIRDPLDVPFSTYFRFELVMHPK